MNADRFNLHAIGSEPDGATPLDADELTGLIPGFVATRGDLNGVEYENIAKALPWARGQARRGGPLLVLGYPFVIELHRKMFEDVWRWSGTLRRRDTNSGVDPSQIAMQMRQILDDAVWWHEHAQFDIDERAARIHARLVAVHPFPNGNGRCTRLVADLYLVSIDIPAFTWGAGADRDDESDIRQVYLDALRAADAGDYEPLARFARS